MTGKNIFVYKLFLSLNSSDFSLKGGAHYVSYSNLKAPGPEMWGNIKKIQATS